MSGLVALLVTSLVAGGRAGGDALLSVGDLLADERDQVAAVVDRVLEGVEAADQEGGHADLVVVQEGLGDLLRRADQRGGAPARAGGGGDRRPQALVVDLALGGDVEQPARADRLGARGLTRLDVGARRADALQVVAGALPRLLLGGAQDRPEGDADA